MKPFSAQRWHDSRFNRWFIMANPAKMIPCKNICVQCDTYTLYNLYMYIRKYIYIEREREICIYIYVFISVYIYILTYSIVYIHMYY